VRGNLNDSVQGDNRHRESNGDSGQVMPKGGWPMKTHFWTNVFSASQNNQRTVTVHVHAKILSMGG
jgi:hypothetical protein